MENRAFRVSLCISERLPGHGCWDQLRCGETLFQRWDRSGTQMGTETEPLKKQSGTETECKTPNGTEVGPKLGPKLGPKWDRSGTEVGPKWDPKGTQMGPKLMKTLIFFVFFNISASIGFGTEVGPKWDRNGTEMGPKWDRNGTEKKPKWDRNATQSGPKLDFRNEILQNNGIWTAKPRPWQPPFGGNLGPTSVPFRSPFGSPSITFCCKVGARDIDSHPEPRCPRPHTLQKCSSKNQFRKSKSKKKENQNILGQAPFGHQRATIMILT